MKKSLIALAVLSTMAGSAVAQSSVTLYGRINPGFADSKVTRADDKATNTAGYQANGWTSPRLGVNIVENLGGGMSAVGTWEANIATEGAAVGTVRQAFAGLRGSFGTVTVGQQYTTEFVQGITVAGTVNSVGFGGAVLADQTTGTAVHRLGEITQGNSVRFVFPKVGGFTFAADLGKVSQDNDITTDAASTASRDTQTDFMGLSANYVAGPLNATLAYSQQKIKASAFGTTAAAVYNVGDIDDATGAVEFSDTTAATCTNKASAGTVHGVTCDLISAATTQTAAIDTKQKNLTASAVYQLTPAAKVFGYYADRETTGTTNLDYKTYNVGASYTIGKITPFIQVSDGEMNEAGTKINDLSSSQIGVTYAFSPRTTAYAYVAEYKNKLAATTETKKSEVTSVGISHNF